MGTAQALIVWPYGGPVYQDAAMLDVVPTEGTALRAGTPATSGMSETDQLLALLPPGGSERGSDCGALWVRSCAVRPLHDLTSRRLAYEDAANTAEPMGFDGMCADLRRLCQESATT
jgi:hypothetical protein